MAAEKDKILKAKEILLKIASGTNPVNGEQIQEESFLHDPRIIRCFYFVAEILDKSARGEYAVQKPPIFTITQEEKEKIKLPEGKIGINEFAKCVNNVLDLSRSKKLTGVVLNKQLKKMGILGEEILPDGKTKTVLNSHSPEYGIESETREFNGNLYEKIVFNEKGKNFLLNNLESIMEIQDLAESD
ncbi:MAG: hypothetical protein ACOYVD_12390 [Bacillota bacterium]